MVAFPSDEADTPFNSLIKASKQWNIWVSSNNAVGWKKNHFSLKHRNAIHFSQPKWLSADCNQHQGSGWCATGGTATSHSRFTSCTVSVRSTTVREKGGQGRGIYSKPIVISAEFTLSNSRAVRRRDTGVFFVNHFAGCICIDCSAAHLCVGSAIRWLLCAVSTITAGCQ